MGMGQREQQSRFAQQLPACRGIGGDVGSEGFDETAAVALAAPGLITVQVLPPAHMLNNHVAGRKLMSWRVHWGTFQLPATATTLGSSVGGAVRFDVDGAVHKTGRGAHINSSCRVRGWIRCKNSTDPVFGLVVHRGGGPT